MEAGFNIYRKEDYKEVYVQLNADESSSDFREHCGRFFFDYLSELKEDNDPDYGMAFAVL